MSKKHQPDDPEQSKRFHQTVRDLAAAGNLDLTEADEMFERGFQRIVPAKPPAPAKDN